MVVFAEVFGELVAGELAATDDTTHDPRLLQHGEVPVGGALRQTLVGLQQLRQRERPVGRGERGDDGPPVAGVALIGVPQPRRGDVVHLDSHHHMVAPSCSENETQSICNENES